MTAENKHTGCPCRNSYCYMERTIDLIGGKWKLRIICSLNANGISRYSELKKALPGITGTMLANSLKEMETDGLIIRTQYNEMPLRVEYSLTEHAKALLPILNELGHWAAAVS